MPWSTGLMNSFGNHAADDFVDELVALARLVRLQADLHVAVLAAAAGLADVLAFRLRLLADGLAIGHLRLADIGLHVELAHHAVDDDLQVQLAHAADDGLSAVGIGVDLEGRIFLRQLAQRDAHLFLVALGLGLDRNRNHRRRELDGLQHDRVLLVADRVAGGDVLQSDAGADVARVDLGDVLALVGVHLQQAADALGARASADVHAVALLQMTGVHADERQLADERVGHDLEGQRRERRVVVRRTLNLFRPFRGPCP